MLDDLEIAPELAALYKAIDATRTPMSCTNYPDAFYPENNMPGTSADSVWAKKMCADCPVLAMCAEYAVKFEAHGIWGGLMPMERRQIRKDLRIVLADRPDAA